MFSLKTRLKMILNAMDKNTLEAFFRFKSWLKPGQFVL